MRWSTWGPEVKLLAWYSQVVWHCGWGMVNVLHQPDVISSWVCMVSEMEWRKNLHVCCYKQRNILSVGACKRYMHGFLSFCWQQNRPPYTRRMFFQWWKNCRYPLYLVLGVSRYLMSSDGSYYSTCWNPLPSSQSVPRRLDDTRQPSLEKKLREGVES